MVFPRKFTIRKVTVRNVIDYHYKLASIIKLKKMKNNEIYIKL